MSIDDDKSNKLVIICSIIFGIICGFFGAVGEKVFIITVFSYFGFFISIFILYKIIKFCMIVFDKEDKLYALVDFLYIDKLGKIFIFSFIAMVIVFFAVIVLK